MRLDKYISSQGSLSRTDVKRLVRQGLVLVDGIKVKNPAMQIDELSATVAVNGADLTYKKHIYIMLNKPKGVVSSTDDSLKKTVIDLVPDSLKREGLFPAGRLDADTTGFVLITDDGDLAHRILSPKNHIWKTYIVTLENDVTEDDVCALQNGLALKSGLEFLPAIVNIIEPKIVEIRICEGKYHQIKRMFAARENRVLELSRIKMGELALDETLELGECREITQKELFFLALDCRK